MFFNKKNPSLVTLILIVTYGAFSQNPFPKVAHGKIVRHEQFPSTYVSARDIDVWLPEQYTKDEAYAVLLMHDGQMLFDSTITWNKQEWNVDGSMQKLMDSAAIKKTIVVGIHNVPEERHSDYFPQKPFETLTQKTQDSLLAISRNDWKLFEKPVQSDGYLKFIVEELLPFIQRTYPVKTDAKNTYIAGSSMGGLISWYALCEYPNVFGGAACLSTHWPGIFSLENNPIPNAFFEYLREHLPESGKHKLYFDHGTETLDALYPELQKKADSLISEKGYTNEEDWKTLKFDGAEHSENAWRSRLAIPLGFLLMD